MAQSGARLREVGTTNRTHPRDYERAIGPDTAMLLKVHPSNYRIVGFTAEVGLRELVELGRAHGVDGDGRSRLGRARGSDALWPAARTDRSPSASRPAPDW